MSDPAINLKNHWLAGVLTLLVPGAGQIYQGRYFKGGLFLVCIVGTFLYGMQLGEWRPVYLSENPGRREFGGPAKRNFGFLAQVGLGVPALIAYVQYVRYRKLDNSPAMISLKVDPHRDSHGRTELPDVPLTETIDAPFSGSLEDGNDKELAKLDGRIELEPGNQTFGGTFKGTLTAADGRSEQVELPLSGKLLLDSKVLGSPRRYVEAGVSQSDHVIKGDVPRAFANWFCAPLDEAVLRDVNGRLNKQFEMALVYTWIAGLLNVLAIWDALAGPAYGYSEASGKSDAKDPSKDAASPENTVGATA